MNYGNFCMVNKTILERITAAPFIHFPAYLLKQKASRTHVVFDRGKRIQGESKMGVSGLLIHSFKSFIELGEDLPRWSLSLLIKGWVISVQRNLLFRATSSLK
jgi:hypothetical protein